MTANVETRYRSNELSVPIQSVTTRLPGGTNGAGADAGERQGGRNQQRQLRQSQETGLTAKTD